MKVMGEKSVIPKKIVSLLNSDPDSQLLKKGLSRLYSMATFETRVEHRDDSEFSDSSEELDSDGEISRNKLDSGFMEYQESPYNALKNLMNEIYLRDKQFQNIKESLRTLKMSDLLNERIVSNAYESSRLKYFEVSPMNQAS